MHPHKLHAALSGCFVWRATVEAAALVWGLLAVPVLVEEATKEEVVAMPEYSWMAMVPSSTEEICQNCARPGF